MRSSGKLKEKESDLWLSEYNNNVRKRNQHSLRFTSQGIRDRVHGDPGPQCVRVGHTGWRCTIKYVLHRQYICLCAQNRCRNILSHSCNYLCSEKAKKQKHPWVHDNHFSGLHVAWWCLEHHYSDYHHFSSKGKSFIRPHSSGVCSPSPFSRLSMTPFI